MKTSLSVHITVGIILSVFVVSLLIFSVEGVRANTKPSCVTELQVGERLQTGDIPVAVAIGDFNRDRKPDFVVANSGSSTISILLNDSKGSFVSGPTYNVGSDPRAVAVGDI